MRGLDRREPDPRGYFWWKPLNYIVFIKKRDPRWVSDNRPIGLCAAWMEAISESPEVRLRKPSYFTAYCHLKVTSIPLSGLCSKGGFVHRTFKYILILSIYSSLFIMKIMEYIHPNLF